MASGVNAPKLNGQGCGDSSVEAPVETKIQKLLGSASTVETFWSFSEEKKVYNGL